jgi:Zn-dependent protease with chaperone function
MISDAFSLVLHLFYIISVFTLLLSSACWLVSPFFTKWLKRFTPESKLTLLRIFGALPFTAAVILATIVTIPALNHDSLLPIDHCHAASGCFGASASHMVTLVELLIAGGSGSLLLWACLSALRHLYRAQKLFKRLELVSEVSQESSVKIIENPVPLAFSFGIFKPIAVLSTGLKNQLSSRQVRIVSVHEEAHTKYRDSLYKWLMRAVCTFHFPPAKKYILEQHALVLEIRADQFAAQIIQSNLDVAETIVAVKKLMSPEAPTELLCQFLASELEQRVHYLLAPEPEQSLSKKTIKLTVLTMLIIAVCASVQLHNTIEFFITR